MNGSDVLEDYQEVIVVPRTEDLSNFKSQEEYLRVIDSLESPRQRLETLIKSTLNPFAELTHEAYYIRTTALVGGSLGLIVGGIFNSRDIHQEYQRKHNASVFDNKYVGNRHFYDTLVTGVVRRGLSMGTRVALLMTSASIISFGSIAYRNRLYFPDFILGFSALGGLSRLWLGSKAVMVGSGLGASVGLLAYGYGRFVELVTQKSVTQLRLLHHREYVAKMEAKRANLQRVSEDNYMRYIQTGSIDE